MSLLTLSFILKNLTLQITFKQLVLELWYFTWVILVIRLFRGYHYFLTCDFDLGNWPIFWKLLTLLITFKQWVLELWYFIWVFFVIRPLFPCDLDLGIWPMFENFKIANNFWTVSARALIVHMSIPCDKTFLWVPLFFTLWPWHWSITLFLKTLTLLITKKNYHWS